MQIDDPDGPQEAPIDFLVEPPTNFVSCLRLLHVLVSDSFFLGFRQLLLWLRRTNENKATFVYCQALPRTTGRCFEVSLTQYAIGLGVYVYTSLCIERGV